MTHATTPAAKKDRPPLQPGGAARSFAFIIMIGLALAVAGFVPADRIEGLSSIELTPHISGETSPVLLLPDLITLAPSDLRLLGGAANPERILRFTNTVANVGDGAMELVGTYIPETGRYRVSQRLFASDGQSMEERLLPAIVHHPGHDHWHIEDFAHYELWSVRPDGSVDDIVSLRHKISYCMIDTDRWTVPQTARPGYSDCVPSLQGLSVGWADSYRSHLDGQWLDVTGLPDGLYALRSIADPYNHLRESNEGNNETSIALRLTGNKVESLASMQLTWDNLRFIGQPE